MIIKFKRIYSFWIELLLMMVICLFARDFFNMFIYSVVSNSYKASAYTYMFVRPLLLFIILIYLVLRNIFNGQSIFQMMFGIKCDYKTKKQLILKNIIDLITLPISFLMILFLNKSIGDYVCKVEISEIENSNKNSSNVFLYIVMVWFTVLPLLFCLAFDWRVSKSERELRFQLNNTQTIKDNIGFIEKFSFSDKISWIQYDKDGKYIEARLKNENNQKYNVKLYYNIEDNKFSYFVINGKKYDYEIERFNLNVYKDNHNELFQEFDDNINVSEITEELSAFKAAREAYDIKYSKDSFNYVGYELFYDQDTDCYMVHYVRSINYDVLGGDCTIIIESSGKVLLIWMGK